MMVLRIFRKWFLSLFLMVTVMLSTYGFAHATIVLGTLSTEPAVPQPGQPFQLTLNLVDPAQVPVEDAVVIAEFRLNGNDPPVSVELVEVESETVFGQYSGELSLTEPGTYQLLLRDQTFRQEEAKATLEVSLGSGPMFPDGQNAFVFPPTATGPRSLATWLIWLIALPIAAGIIVTVLVLLNTRGTKEEAGDD